MEIATYTYSAESEFHVRQDVRSKGMPVLLQSLASAVPSGRLCWVSAYISSRLGHPSIASEHLREEEHAKA